MVFFLRLLQEKCREQQQPLFVAFIDLTKAFDLVSRDGLFKILPKIGCPPRLLNIIRSFHEKMKGTAVFDGSTSDPFDIRSGVKQGCVLAPTLFGMYSRRLSWPGSNGCCGFFGLLGRVLKVVNVVPLSQFLTIFNGSEL